MEHFTFDGDIRSNAARRNSFFDLARQTFGLSFEDWYRAGYWTDAYRPYALLDGERVVANVSVSLVGSRFHGQPLPCWQIGTVMTAEDCRGLGLAKFLMERVIADLQSPDSMLYLYANDAVLDFYPRFGFEKAEEYESLLPAPPAAGGARRLDMRSQTDVALLRTCYGRGNPHCELPMLDNWGLLMFHCGSYLADCVYHAKAYDAAIVAQRENDTLLVYDVFGGGKTPLADIIATVASPGVRQVQLGFAPKDAAEAPLTLRVEEDTTLFVHKQSRNIFSCHKTMLPLLSHA